MTSMQHCILRASAGTGKTFALSNRFLALLFLGAEPESILATTFTRKAAGEVMDRVMLRLAKAATSDEEARLLAEQLGLPRGKVDRGRCLAVLVMVCKSLHRLSIATIDSFMARMARGFRLELGLPASPQMAGEDEPKVLQLRMAAIEAVLAEDDPQVLVDLLRRLHHDAAQRSIASALDDIVGELYEVYRQAPEAELWNQLPIPKGLLSPKDVVQWLEQLEALESELPKNKNGQPNQSWAKAWHQAVKTLRLRNWQGFLESGLAQALYKQPPSYQRVELPTNWQKVLQTLHDHARAFELSNLARQTQATFELLKRFDQHYTRLRQAHQLMLFADLPELLARRLPQIPEMQTELYYRLDARVQHLLLDEFQDTSLDQWQVLEPIAQEVASVGDSSRTFFCVGDVKQAIYAWRGGCAELFDKVTTDLHLQDHQSSLTKSYRSSEVVLETVNQVFSGLGSNLALAKDEEMATRWQNRFERHEAAKDLPGYVELVTSEPEEAAPAAGLAGAGNPDEAEPDHDQEEENDRPGTNHMRYVAARVFDLYQHMPGKSIGILVRSNKAIRPLLFALWELNVPASGEGGNPLTDDPAVNAVLAAFTLADHPGHQVAAFHLANSPLGAKLGLQSTGMELVQKVSAQLRRTLLVEGYAATVSRWRKELMQDCGEHSLQRLAQLVELAQSFEPDAGLRPQRFVEYVQQSRVQAPTVAQVRVMTIHQSKGLEFDQVVLPELGNLLARPQALGVYVLRDKPTGPIQAVFRATNQEMRELSPVLEEAYQQERARRLQDDLCALYVAMTRARHGLLMVLQPRKLTRKLKLSTKGWLNLCSAAILRQALSTKGEDESPVGREILYSRGNPHWYQPAKKPSAKQAQAPVPTTPIKVTPAGMAATHLSLPTLATDGSRWKRVVSPSTLENRGLVAARDILGLRSDDGRGFGVFIHTCLSAIDWLEPEQPWPGDEYFGALIRKNFPRADAAWVREALAELRRMLQAVPVRRVFTKPANGPEPELWRERAFWVPMEEELLSGQFDRVVVYGCADKPRQVDHAVLWDFKTDHLAEDASALQRSIDHYRAQMQAYRKALMVMLKLPWERVRCHLVYLQKGLVLEVGDKQE